MPRTHLRSTRCLHRRASSGRRTRTAQAKDAFVEGLTQFINAVDGTYGDEGPALTAAVEAMARGLAEWDARVARVESGFRADVDEARAPPAAARMRATLGTVYLERGRFDDALTQFAAAVRSRSIAGAGARASRRWPTSASNRPAEAAAAYRAAWQANPAERDHGVSGAARLEPSTPAAREALLDGRHVAARNPANA